MTAETITEPTPTRAPERGELNITAADLRALLVPLKHYVSDTTVPTINGFQITTAADTITATATDRFRAARVTLPHSGSGENVELFLSAADYRTIAAVWPIRKTESATFRFTRVDDTVRVDQIGGLDGIVDAHLSFRLPAGGKYPAVSKIIDDAVALAVAADPKTPSVVGLNPRFLGDLKDFPAERGRPVRMDLVGTADGGVAKQAVIRGGDLTVVIMAMRLDLEAHR